MADFAIPAIVIVTLIVILVIACFVIRCLTQGKICQNRTRLEGKCVVITGADSPVGIELVREMCKRGASRVIMAVEDVEIGQVSDLFLFFASAESNVNRIQKDFDFRV